MKVFLCFLTFFIPSVLFGQAHMRYEFYGHVFNKYRSSPVAEWNKNLFYSLEQGSTGMGFAAKYSPNIEKRLIYGFDLLSNRNNLEGPGFDYWNIHGYLGYDILQRKSFGLTLGLKFGRTFTRYMVEGDTVLYRKNAFTLSPEIDLYFKVGKMKVFNPKVRLKYEPSVGYMPSNTSVSIVLGFGHQVGGPRIKPIQSKRSSTVLFYAQGMGDDSNQNWNFGDGTTSTEVTPSKTYSQAGKYTVTLTTSFYVPYDSETRTGGYTSTRKTSTTVVILQKSSPTSYFDFVPIKSEIRLVSFKNKSQNGDSYWWEFDDGATSEEMNPIHRFQNKGTYNVKLTVTDSVTGEKKAYQQKIRF
jgi:chitodextrinase